MFPEKRRKISVIFRQWPRAWPREREIRFGTALVDARMVDCSVLDEVRRDPSFRRFVSEANSAWQSCRHCFDSGKWPAERAWSVLFNAQIEVSVQGRLESVWESTTMLLAGCPKSMPELMAEVYLTRAEVAIRQATPFSHSNYCLDTKDF